MITIDRLEKYLRASGYSLQINSGVFQYYTSDKFKPVIVKLLEDRAEVWIEGEQNIIESHMNENGF